ncbi:Mullerian inhibiting substance type II receptor precursor [Oryzias latipes]|uniref:receptor protein serine/threonine kinase n=1 Tax=Oryzias latipes TaxID=8090 RepID=A4PBT1_ORYLA|nr:Mullerian inhibiting substance type II receptor precursor [Oryzias latipes]BAF51975.1 Mullerian inhibiting substance type II receptor [Oryzias latipes]
MGKMLLWILALYCLKYVFPQSLLPKRTCVFQVSHKNNGGHSSAGNVSGSLQICENTRCCMAIYRMINGQPQVDTLACGKVETLCPDATCKVQPRLQNRFIGCVCGTDLCNSNFTWTPDSEQHSLTDSYSAADISKIVVLVMFPILAFALAAKWIYLYKKKEKNLLSVLPNDNILQPCSCQTKSSESYITNIELQQVVGQGHFATVFKGNYTETAVAVKVYPAGWKDKFTTEKDIYELPLMRHAGIAHFLGAGRNPRDRSWFVVVEFAEHGSLHSFLCENTLSWMQAQNMCLSLSQGLSYLHSDLHSQDVHKPAVAHRDLSSFNVLVRADGSCALCDFGCSTILRSCSGPWVMRQATNTKGYAQLGTPHYMSPEILEGSVNLNNSSFLLQADIYALSLILWEIWMRCSDLSKGGTVPQHLLPYELELEGNVTLERLILYVCEMDRRPSIPEPWELLPQGSAMKELLTECWDRDTDARLTAHCVVDRLVSLQADLSP